MAGLWFCPACGAENPAATRFCGQCGGSRAGAASAAAPEGQQVGEQRRLVTALFADVSGFTPLAQSLDSEALLDVIDPIVAGMAQVVGRYGGFVEKYAGDAVAAVFGAPISHEDDAQRAARAALEMLEVVDGLCRELGPEASDLTLHIGINTGHGIARVLSSDVRVDYGVLGDVLIVAQRLESAAPPGQIYVSDATYRLAHGEFAFDELGALELKGRNEPVRAWRLVGLREPDSDGGPAQVARIFGRDSERRTLVAGLDALAAGNGGVVAIIGEAGIGKSRLVEAAAAHARHHGLAWLAAPSVSYGTTLPYSTIAALVRGAAGFHTGAPPKVARERLGTLLAQQQVDEYLDVFAQLLGVSGGADAPPPALEPEAFQRRFHAALWAWLRALCADRPTVLVLEDVHWADAASGDVVEWIAGWCSELPLLLILTARPEAPVLARAGERTDIDLSPLDDDDVDALIDAELGGSASVGLLRALRSRSGGNPFYALEMVRALAERGQLAKTPAGWGLAADSGTLALPETIEGVLGARLDQLPDDANRVLQTCSVIGRRVPVTLLQDLCGADLDAATGLLVDRGLLAPSDAGELTFVHALVQDVANSRLLRRERTKLHLAVATAAEVRYGALEDTTELLARHLYLGGASRRALPYLERAGARARRLFANAEAIEHLQRAAEIAAAEEMSERLPELLLDLAETHGLVGDLDAAARLYGRVRDMTGSISAWRGLAATLRQRGEYTEALRVLGEARHALRVQESPPAPLALEEAWTLSVMGRHQEAIALARRALDADDGEHDPSIARLLLQLSRLETLVGERDAALAHAEHALAILEQDGDRPGQVAARRRIAEVLRVSGRHDEAAGFLGAARGLSEEVGDVEGIAACLLDLGALELDRGDLDEAIDQTRRAIAQFGRVGLASGRVTGYANLAEMLIERGDDPEAVEAARAALDQSRVIGHVLAAADARRTLGIAAARREAMGEAEEEAREAARLFSEMGLESDATDALMRVAEALRHAGHPTRADALSARAANVES